MMEVGYDAAELETADLHAARAAIYLRWNGMRSEVPFPIWRNQQRIAALLNHEADPGRASHVPERINKKMYPVGS